MKLLPAPSACCITLIVALIAACAGSAEARAATALHVAPESFVAGFDGDGDSAVVTYHLDSTQRVQVRVIRRDTNVVVRTIDRGLRAAGDHQIVWDGRDARGQLQPPGSYVVDVVDDATVRVSALRRVSADVTIAAAPLSLTAVRLSRPVVGARGSTGSTSMRFVLSTAGSVVAAVTTSDGRLVRTLVNGTMPRGPHTTTWDATDAAGRRVADGAYVVQIVATGSDRPTSTVTIPLRVDGAIPHFTTTPLVVGRTRAGTVTYVLPVTASKPGTVVLRSGSVRLTRTVRAGRSTIVVSARQLGRNRVVPGRSLVAVVSFVDAAGNVSTSRRVRLTTPRRAARRTTPPAPHTRTPAPSTTGFVWPATGIVTSSFGLRDGRMHQGIDIGAPTGTQVRAAASGTVTFVGQMQGYGNVVVVEHAPRVHTWYAHLSMFAGQAVGTHVDAGTPIGNVGCTGHCTGPHLHFEVRIGVPPADVQRNPMAYLPAQ